MKVCILDAGPLIHLDELSSLLLLEAMGTLFCPETVAMEAEFHRPGIFQRAPFVQIVEAPTVPSAPVPTDSILHAGELSALAWAEKFGADVFLSDDAEARSAAVQTGLDVCGTIGVILNAVREEVMGRVEASRIIGRIPKDSTLHVKASVLAFALDSLR